MAYYSTLRQLQLSPSACRRITESGTLRGPANLIRAPYFGLTSPFTKACPECGADMRRTEEKGVDVRMSLDTIKLASVDNYDVAVLVSSEADFVPVAEFLETRGIKVIHGAFPPKGHHLSSCCWGQIDLPRLREEFRFRKGE